MVTIFPPIYFLFFFPPPPPPRVLTEKDHRKWFSIKRSQARGCSSAVERSLCMWKAPGSIPGISTIIFTNFKMYYENTGVIKFSSLHSILKEVIQLHKNLISWSKCIKLNASRFGLAAFPLHWQNQVGRQGRDPPGSEFFHCHAVFGKNLKTNSNLGSWRTPLGKSWIRHCFS